MATVVRVMVDPDPSSDPDGDATDTAGTGPDGADGRGSGAGTRATPRLANLPDGDADTARAGADDADTTDRSVADPGSIREPEPIEPEAPSAENALFVFLGVVGTVGLLASAVPGVL